MAPALATIFRGEMGKVSDTCAPRADIPHAMHMQCDILLRGGPLTGQEDVSVPSPAGRRHVGCFHCCVPIPKRGEAQERDPVRIFPSESTAEKEA